MPAQIFLSCGQASSRERDAAVRLREYLSAQGFQVYVAIQAQSIQDVNSSIIRQLERSDYYLFVDFRREELGPTPTSGNRGSLFTHQELAIAYRSGFEQVLLFQETGTKLEGLLRYMAGNATSFDSIDELATKVAIAIRERNWTPTYSRHLIATRPRWSQGTIQYGPLIGRFLYVDIENKRPDLAAMDDRYISPNRSHLKTTGQPGFNQVIWPQSHGAFDVLMVARYDAACIFLNSALDVPPAPLIAACGHYGLEYAVLARDFPVLHFTIDLEVTGRIDTTTATLRESGERAA